MPSRGESFVITYMAWDFPNQEGKTGDASNHTLFLIRDGIESSPSGSPTEIDSNGIPGMYKLQISAAESQCSALVVAGSSSSVGVSIVPSEVSIQ